jgi:hypothetical protein
MPFISIFSRHNSDHGDKRRNPCLNYVASTPRKPTDIVMNQVIPVTQEAPISFGKVKI